MYICKNYRPNLNSVQMPGAPWPHMGQIIADLYEGDKFYRSAVVADLGKTTKAEALKYCENRNKVDG